MNPIHIIGMGRLGSALHHAWRAAGLGITDRIEQAGVVVLTVPDDAVADVAASLAGRLDPAGSPVVLHCAGALDSSILLPSGAAAVGTLHPVQTVPGPDPEADAASLFGAWAGVEGDPAAVAVASELATAAGLRPVELTAESKPLWHAAAVLACNDLVALLHVADRLLVGAAGVPEGVQVLLPLVRKTLDNVQDKGLAASLTGPVARGDSGTVARHLQALAPHPEARAVYEALDAAARDLAGRRAAGGPADPSDG